MNIRDLEYFLAVAEFQHFGEAARYCHVSQPTLSGQIKKLEKELGVSLFERSNRSVLLTDAGKSIRGHAARILSGTQEIFEIANQFDSPLSGRFRLGGIPTVSPYLFPKIVSAVKSSMPDLTLNLVEEKTAVLVEMLRGGEIDAAYVALPVPDEILMSQDLFEDVCYLAVPEGHELSSLKEVKIDDIANREILLLEDGHCLRGQALEFCSTVAIGEYDFRATSLETLRLMVKAGTGVTIFPEMAIRKNERDIRYIPFVPSLTRRIGLIWRKTTVRMPVIEQLLKIF